MWCCGRASNAAPRLAGCPRPPERGRLRWRSLLGGLLLDVGDGVTTPLERRYATDRYATDRFATDVERAQGLPRGYRNKLEVRGGRRRYRDVRNRRWRLIVELDGRAAHIDDERELDDPRDNEVRTRGEQTLRYGWRSVTIHSCLTASQVAALP